MVSDVVVVGGGTAGCILASRLSEDPKRSVLLLEAGPDFVTTEELPADIQSAKYPPLSHDWGYVGTAGEGSAPVLLPRGKIIGGSSSTNYCFAMRTRPADHDAWAALGLDGGGFEDVLPIYRAMENDQGGDEQWHGRDGLFMFVSNVQPRSRGSVTLAAREPAAAPVIDLGFYRPKAMPRSWRRVSGWRAA